MDDFNSLIPLYQDDDPFLFQYTSIPTIPCPNDTIFQDLQNHGPPAPDSSLISSSPRGESDQVVTTTTTKQNNKNKGKRLSKPSNTQDSDNGNLVDDEGKRAVHRDIERQRRQEMANLYASLRMLLPLEYIKGKRATTDHIHQGVNYIKHMEKKIRELEMKRTKLRHLLGDSHLDVQNAAEVLNVLLTEGLTVVSCIYTKVNQKFHCTIQTKEGSCQMNDGDLYTLQEKLNAKVIDWKNSGPS